MAETETTEGQQGGENANLKHLRERAAQADESEKALASAQREIALLKSGIDVEHPVGKLFVKAYDGEATPEAIKAAAQEYGVPVKGEAAQGQPEGTEGGQTQEPPEPTGTDVRQTLASGAPPDTGVEPDPNQIGLDQFKTDLQAGMVWEEASGRFLNHLANAANRGDTRVLVREPR